ncbi:hypothetical protein Syn7502_02940 [Synechococcus sp. PCC 7502]|uniref:zinc ribbon domain-containing protein n=1 Tax=Synechococcus sp. PCC 7502 TaxID=1173263 RepID=UPI00029FB83D|nr:zinc ribbon domain-containing protein [Synechococcus sp. PCC 7502]AFY74865.1 hypothetical protein Syn7502_02940 [Synechococcus sp. PCC 7502]
MIRNILRFLNSFFSSFLNRSSTINNEPVNRVSLIVIILVDIFILVNVFTGLYDISRWHLSPLESYPCHQEWANYQGSTASNKNYEFANQAIIINTSQQQQYRQSYLYVQENHLGQVAEECLIYADIKDQVNSSENKQITIEINGKYADIYKLEDFNRTIKSQYDSSLLEKIAQQPQTKSINQITAEKAKQQLEQNQKQISKLNQQISILKTELLAKPEVIEFINLLNDSSKFKDLESGYDRANFWYPSIQIGLQSLFLLPLIAIAVLINNYSSRKGFGLVSLISWHLLVIFLIPLLLKIFEFLQIGIIFKFISDVIQVLFGELLFLISYVYIFIIPLVGFLIIKFFQKVTGNQKGKIITRVQKFQCIRCAKKIRSQDLHCPYCGFEQHVTCENCQTATYKFLPYCNHCGYRQVS